MELADVLHPLVISGVVGINPFQVLEQTSRPVIACVDDSQTIQQFVRLALESSGI